MLSAINRANLVQKAVDKNALKTKALKAFNSSTRILQPKYDGCHTIIVNTRDAINAFTRQGKRVLSLHYQLMEIANQESLIGRVLFAEAWLPDTPHRIINGRFRSHSQQELNLYVFDAVPFVQFVTGSFSASYRQRLHWLRYALKPSPHVKLVETFPSSDEGLLPKERGAYDGVISWDADAHWEAGLGLQGQCVKIKNHLSVDLKVLDVRMGTGKLDGALASLLVDYKGRGIIVSAGRLDYDERKAIANDPSIIIGKVVEVRALEETSKGELREATVVRIRDDKTEPSYS
jgi:ATP-dependent DNA ligase